MQTDRKVGTLLVPDRVVWFGVEKDHVVGISTDSRITMGRGALRANLISVVSGTEDGT